MNRGKGEMNRGKRGDYYTDGATPIMTCNTTFSEAGRYVLDRNIRCVGVKFGVTMLRLGPK
jgi:hypothetical protein